MRALLLCCLVAGVARAEDGPLRHRYGDSLLAVYGVGDVVAGSDASLPDGAHPFRRYSGALGLGLGSDFVLTSFGALVGFEAELELGGGTGNQHADGVTRYNLEKASDEAEASFGLSLRAGGRIKVSPVWFKFSDSVGLRLGLLTGLAFDWYATEAWNQVGSFNVGAQAFLQASSFSLTASALYTPPQGPDWQVARAAGSVTIVIGRFVVGARFSLVNARPVVATPTRAIALVAEQTISGTIGVAFGD